MFYGTTELIVSADKMRKCSGCKYTAKKLARCTRCDWVAYCSKDCQRSHWQQLHRSQCSMLSVCSKFRRLEDDWWSSKSQADIAKEVTAHGLQPESLKFYGELAFVLAGLKPCALLSNLPRNWRESYIKDVIVDSGVLAYTSDICAPKAYYVSSSLQTQIEYDLTGQIVIMNGLENSSTSLIQELHLTPINIHSNCVNLNPISGSTPLVTSEELLAKALDYPVVLTSCDVDMIEIGYFDDSGELLTSFGSDKSHRTAVENHFRRYRNALDGVVYLTKKESQLSA